jgi:glycyl-tRNA synthetase
VNFDSLNDKAVTVRERDSMQEVRIGIGAQGYLAERLAGC